MGGSARAASYISSEWLKLIVANAEQFGILSVVTALAVRFLFWEDWEENYRIRKTYMEELERKFDEASESDSVSVDTNTSERLVQRLENEYYLENLDQLSGHTTATRWTGPPTPQV